MIRQFIVGDNVYGYRRGNDVRKPTGSTTTSTRNSSG